MVCLQGLVALVEVDMTKLAVDEVANFRRAQPDTGELRERLAQSKPADRNGLSAEQNDRLFATSDIDEIVALLLRGVRAMAGD